MATIEHCAIDGNELWWLSEGPGAHAEEPQDGEVVEIALKGRFRFAEETETEDGLRRPQIVSLHAILAYRSTQEREPITVVMPTGTGKTETMLAAYCHSPSPTLVYRTLGRTAHSDRGEVRDP